MMISQAGEQALRRELSELVAERADQLPRRLQRAREFGDAGANDEYLQIMEEQAVRDARIQSIRQILASADVVGNARHPAGVATIGSTVTLMLAGRETKRRILGAHEPIGQDGVSAESPIGKAIVGRNVGDVVTAELPNGEKVDLEVLAVRPSGVHHLPAVTA